MEEQKLDGFFKKIHESLKCGIKNEDLKKFVEIENNTDKLKFIYQLQAVKECNILDYLKSYNASTFPEVKDAEYAKNFKNEGNLQVQKGDWAKALEFYNKSYITMPQNLREDLSIVLANRSAALFHLDHMSACLDDIKRCLSYDYPRHIRYKVMERRAQCLLALNRNNEAADAFRETVQALDDAQIPLDKKQKAQKDAQIMLEILTRADKMVINQRRIDEKPKSPPKPKLKGNSNKDHKSLSEAVSIESDKNKGRYAAAVKDISAGEILLVEEPMVSVLLGEYAKSHCQHCFKKCSIPIACPHCPNIVFCSDDCSKTALNAYHKYECPILPVLWKSGCSITCHMALRLIIQNNMENLKKIQEENSEIGLYGLVSHEDKRTGEDIFHRMQMVTFLTKLAQVSGYFEQKPKFKMDDNLISTLEINESEIRNEIALLIFKNLQVLQFNAHEVFELQCSKPDVGKNVLKHEGKSVFLGGAMFKTLSLFNHSCEPGVVRYYNGKTIVVRAVKNIKVGEEVSENYGPIFTKVIKSKRQEQLKEQYWFDCHCIPCDENWPLYSDMNENYMRFRCDSDVPCNNVVAVPHDCNDLMVQCGLCQQHTNILKGLKNLQDTDKTVNEGKLLMESGKYSEAMKKFIQVLKLYDTTLVPPYKAYYDCIQNLRSCIVSLGNYSIVQQ